MDTIIKTGQPAPLFQLLDLNGKKHSLRDYTGKVVVLNFWSAECPWAARVDEEIIPMLLEWGPRLALICIASNANESLELITQTARQRKLPLVLLDPNAAVAAAYGAQTTPHFFVVDAIGMLRYQGAFDDVNFQQSTPTQNYLSQAVQAVFAGESPEPTITSAYGCAIVVALE